MFRYRHHILRVHKISIKSTVGKLLLIKSRTFQLNNITLHPTVEAVPEQRASLTTEDEEQWQIPVVHELNPLLSQDDYEHEEISEVVGTEEDLLATATKNNYGETLEIRYKEKEFKKWLILKKKMKSSTSQRYAKCMSSLIQMNIDGSIEEYMEKLDKRRAKVLTPWSCGRLHTLMNSGKKNKEGNILSKKKERIHTHNYILLKKII